MSVRHVLLGCCTLLAVLAVAADEPPPEVRADTVDGRTVTGRLLTAPIKLENEFGIHELRPSQVRRITTRPPDAEHGHDVVELSDKSEMHGTLRNPTISIDTGSGIESFTPG